MCGLLGQLSLLSIVIHAAPQEAPEQCTDSSNIACHAKTVSTDIASLLQASVSAIAHGLEDSTAKAVLQKQIVSASTPNLDFDQSRHIKSMEAFEDINAEQRIVSKGRTLEQIDARGDTASVWKLASRELSLEQQRHVKVHSLEGGRVQPIIESQSYRNNSASGIFFNFDRLVSDGDAENPIVYQDSFEDLDVGSTWCAPRSGSTCEVGQVGTNRYLRVSYKPYPRGSGRLATSSPIQPPRLAANLSYHVFFETDFEWVKGGKLGAGLFGGKGTTGCKPIVPDGWSARLMWRRNGQLTMYLYHQHRKEKCGDNYYAMDGKARFHFKKGVWYTIKLSITLNDPVEESNGRAELFVDGVSRAVADGLQWRKVDKAKIDKFRLSTFYGGSNPSWSPSNTTHIRYDNFVVRATPASTEPDAFCKKGIKKGNVCCGSSCGKCGGSGCASRPGGGAKCCSGSIKRRKHICASTDETGCLIP